jgi:hypothetical protein
MDDFNRSTTTLVSQYNTEHVPCGNSVTKNKIFVTIPVAQVAPYWATRYKFVIKADRDNYESIYTNIFFLDPETANAYFLLEGENARKVEVGSRLIVKADSSGAVDNCAYATVLEKESQPADFIKIPSPSSPSTDIPVPSGVYIKIKANDFSIIFKENSYISAGLISDSVLGGTRPFYPRIEYPMNIEDPAAAGFYIDYDVPQGSIIKMKLKNSY